ncbi:MAG: trypsin-like serine protease [Nevskiales bacterium]|nr:trypsin-like serine protease [Nevskiales bacterium]
MRLPRYALAAALLGAAASAQAFSPDLVDLDALPLLTTAVDQVQAKVAAVEANPAEQRRFAVAAPLAAGLDQGVWDEVSAGQMRWRTRVFSAGAKSINLTFSQFALPSGAALWLYDPQGRNVQGPYTRAEQAPDGKLWTAIVLGESAVIELRVPKQARDAVALQLASVNHGFRRFGTSGSIAKSGSCNIDVVCPLGDDWRDEIRSVALITIGGVGACSGQLVNNVRQNDDPLFLTADHCEIGDDAQHSPSSVVVYWNYETSVCGGNPDGSLSQNQTGSTLLADDIGSDFTLLRLNQPPSNAFDVHYAGWNAGTTPPQSGVSIHHPSADEKRISAYSIPAVKTDNVCIEYDGNNNCSRLVKTWEVKWAQGTTEQGSSGSGLWNQDHRIVGVLSGGLASCDAQTQPDYYARLDAGWTAGSASSQQLKAHLDPDNTGTLTLAGKDPGPVTTPSGGGGGGGALGHWFVSAMLLGAALRRRRIAG